MTPNHYETLGIAPTSEDVVVRAAYRALIRRYHPDSNASSEAAERARAINAAYAVLGDPERRADYDSTRVWSEMPEPRPRRAGPIAAGLTWAVALGLLLFAILTPPAAVEDLDPAATAPAVAASSATQPQSGPAAASLDILPEPVRASTAGVAAEIPTPNLQPTAVRAAAAAQPRQPPPPTPAPEPATVAQRSAAPTPAPAAAAAAAPAKPSFDCRFASGGAEQAVCKDSNLALLDDRMAVLYSQSWGRADEARRAMLLETRSGFVERRDGCTSDSCIADAYLKRMREISDIMGGQGRPR